MLERDNNACKQDSIERQTYSVSSPIYYFGFAILTNAFFSHTGQGRFGKVYTVVNNQTGELLAMKEVQLQPGDHRAIRRVAEELQIFEGIQHQYLVRYYGLEIHRVR